MHQRLRQFFVLPSFRQQTAFFIGMVVVVLAAVLSVLASQMLKSQIERDKGAALAAIARGISKTLEQGMRARSQQVQVLAGSAELWRAGLGSRDVAHMLQRSQASRAHAAWIGVADLDGVVRGATDNMLLGKSVAERPWFQQGMKGAHVGDVHAAKLLASLLPPSANGEPLRFVDFSSPITLDGKVIGVVGMHGNWEWARSVINSMMPVDSALEHLQIFIVSFDGLVLHASRSDTATAADAFGNTTDSPTAHRLPTGDMTVRWQKDKNYLTAAADVSDVLPNARLGWQVIVRQPTEVAFQDADRSVRVTFAMGALCAAAAAAVAWMGATRLARPVTRMARAALDVERGVAGATIPVVSTNRELRDLSNALSSMTMRLVEANERLEQRVEARTKELLLSNAKYEQLSVEQHAMLDNDIVGIVKLRGRHIVWANRALSRLFGYSPGELLHQPSQHLFNNEDFWKTFIVQAPSALAASGGHHRAQVPMRCKNGTPIWVDVSGALLSAESEESLWLMIDITAQRAHQEQIEHIAFHDPLTGLANRLLLADRVRHGIALDQRLKRKAALCYMDLDGFKSVNDQHGHDAGDELLKEVARRLAASVRASDTVARLGGDEFVLLLTPLELPHECDLALKRVLQTVNAPVHLSTGATVHVSASIGVALYPECGDQPAQLMAFADAAMYDAKRSGKNQVRFHAESTVAA